MGWQIAAVGLAMVLCGLLAWMHGGPARIVFSLLGSVFFLALAWLRIGAILTSPRAMRPARRQPDRTLPVYTVLVPTFEETAAIPGLLKALAQLDYPADKLDIKILVEEDDARTLAALARAAPLPPSVRVVVAPRGQPRTKPRALNVGLRTARGAFTVVYDAEDRPHPGQLRAALDRFAQAGPRVAVVQARLVIDHRQRGFWADQFRLEYAGLFAVLLPALSTFGLPVPLGGSSNHFRTATLRQVGGWDAHNVTEDADLGMRLHRFGYRAATIDSPTEEEAPTAAGAWVRQRSRWMKGWMVTLLVHTRSPRTLVRDMGPRDASAFLLMTGGLVLSALLEPVCLLPVLAALLVGESWLAPQSLLESFAVSAFLVSLVIGHLAGAAIGIEGLRRTGGRISPVMCGMIVFYWLAVSFATWRALRDLLFAPEKWEKTEHVLARMPGEPAGAKELHAQGE
jgi:cellulose synthase/poly-beta-1,6-N-acetylglucosamine synthase-like glycosyltransferase